MGIRCWAAAVASAPSALIFNPACALRDSSTRCIPAYLLDSLQPVLFDLVNQIAIFRQQPRPFYFEGLVLRECPLCTARVPLRCREARIHPETHAEQHVLVARGRKHLIVAREILVARRPV